MAGMVDLDLIETKDPTQGPAAPVRLDFALCARRADILDNTGGFDAEWYAAAYGDVALLGMDPKSHYLRYGAMLGRGISASHPTGAGLDLLVAALGRPREISYCTPVMNRPDDIRGTLGRNLRANAEWRERIEFIVLFFDQDRETQDWIRERFAKEIRDGYLRLAVSDKLDGWHFGKAKNAFREIATGAVYSSLDGDNFVTAEETQQLLKIHAAHPDDFVFHHFTGEWGDGSSGRVSLPMALYRAVGYDEGFLPRQYDESDMILSTLARFPGVPLLRYETERHFLKSKLTQTFLRERGGAIPVLAVDRVHRQEALNPKGRGYVSADPVIEAMEGFNQALSFAKNAPDAELKSKYLDRAVKYRHRLVDAAPADSLIDMLFEKRPAPAPRVDPAEICLFACMKDDGAYLQAFHLHYKRLGVARFFIVDDGSASPIESRLRGEEVHVFRPKVGTFAAAKGLWLEAVIKAFLPPDAWFLTVDADEFLDLPPPHGTLGNLVAALEARGAGFAPGLLIDMLPNAALAETPPEAVEARFLELFDEYLLLDTPPSEAYARHPSIRWGFGPHAGLSWSVDARYHGFGTLDSLRKLPLLRHRPKQHLNQGFHSLHPTDGTRPPGTEIWDTGLVLPIRHYKLAKLFSAEGRRRTLAKVSGPAGLAYHARTAENIGHIFGTSPEEALARLRTLPRRRYPRPALVIDPQAFSPCPEGQGAPARPREDPPAHRNGIRHGTKAPGAEEIVVRAPETEAWPFLICTLQRTGGTNLTNNLERLSPFGTAQHELFNRPRSCGHVTRAWEESGDRAALETAIRAVCARRENIKHCVEMVPWEVTEALLAASRAAGFRHFFLYRRDSLGRILSMEYAQRTKVWGPRHIEKAAADARAFAKPLDVSALIRHETRCIEFLDRAWAHLCEAGATPVALAYEDLYGADAALAADAFNRVLRRLGLSRGAEADAALLAELRGRGDQHTRDRYARFIGIEALRTKAAALPKPGFATEAAEIF